MTNSTPDSDRAALYDVDVTRDIRIPTSVPHVTLSADVYRPLGVELVPALVTVLPYRKDFWMGPALDASFRWFAERGYACLLADLGGTGSSDGPLRPPLDPGEGDDAVAVIEWAAEQPWCTGNIGMWGLSYGGFATLRAATRRPSALKAIIPIMNPSDPEQDRSHPDGARGDLHTAVHWGGIMLMMQLLPPLLNHTSLQEQRRWYDRLHNAEPYILDPPRHRAGDPVWRDRAIDLESITVPALCVGGWRDVHCRPIIRAFEQIQGPKKLLMGPWAHTMPHESSFEAIDFLPLALRWWDHWLREIDNGVMDEPPVTLHIPGDRPRWRTFESWSPATDELVLATGTDTTLTEFNVNAPPSFTAIAEYHPDPTTGALSGLWGSITTGAISPLDQHDDDMRALSATSEPLLDALTICGRPEATIHLARDKSDQVTRIVVRLAEVDPQGRSTIITAGAMCRKDATDIYLIALRPTAYRVRAGNRLRVVVSDSDFPRLAPPADPCPMRVARIELRVPRLNENAGKEVDIPAIATAADEPAEAAERWTITRDPIHDGIEVVIIQSRSRSHTTEGHLAEMLSELSAKVRRQSPDAAVSLGTHTAVVQMKSGENITVTASARCTQTTLWARGEVTIDDLTVYSRIWDVPLTV